MAQSTLSMRVDETLKKSFDNICDDFGFTSTAAITVFMKTVVRERRIPFEIKASTKEQVNKDAWAAFLEMRAAAAEAGIQDMSLDEINAEIQEARNGR
ncbi:MAG: type II toxin-antitoxin system RelB/DinJ family antitoxin [Candidatus Cryptobacteroides sp.]|nr:type II toxin-antitoxin system RelB/DinJ family antitoxin [Bacteroidales bacterium]MDY2860121.1 type II toxin-antitoxin system RelB/DinJ family antitoxin [Candidatus Cryptobacteroides sp.]MDY4571571.1 type II toxin-antitoxin system RelB/DinJ family antitoxin [Candidatus Cryptobacteroides sp.]MDY5442378.1 type II toxin-antitoxin system RelB/DinJ family antitoxin [Candidatus Cryptobacteroides sp.]